MFLRPSKIKWKARFPGRQLMAWQDARILRRKCLESMGPRNAVRKQPFISLEHGEPSQ